MNNGHNNSAESRPWSSQPVDALAAQARACADSLRLVSQTRRVQDACDVLEQCARALAAIPAKGETLWQSRSHYPEDGWGDWTNIDPNILTFWKERVKNHPERFELRSFYLAPTPPTAPAQDAQDAWKRVREEVGTKGWTVGESCDYFGFFMHGWRAALRASSPAERIEALEADRDCWIEQCSQRVADWSEAQARIEADEALMRTAAESLNDLSLGLCDDVRIARCDAAITALRKRLESSNAS